MSVIDVELAKRIRETRPLVHLTTIYGRDACAAEVESSSGDGSKYQVLCVVDQGDLQASCRCPYWRKKGRYCKHVLATVLEWHEECRRLHL